MKQLFLSACAVALLVAGTSCNKSYTCECEMTYSANGVQLFTNSSSESFKTTKNDAHDRCASSTNTFMINGGMVGLDTTIAGQEMKVCNLR